MKLQSNSYFFVVTLLIAFLFGQNSYSETSDQLVSWRISNTVWDAVSQEVTDLLISLYNINKLPVKEIEDKNGKTISHILIDENINYGRYFTLGLDALLCDLNKKVGNVPPPVEIGSAGIAC